MQKEGIPGEEGRRGSAKGEPRKGGWWMWCGQGGERDRRGQKEKGRKDAFLLSNFMQQQQKTVFPKCVKPFQDAWRWRAGFISTARTALAVIILPTEGNIGLL